MSVPSTDDVRTAFLSLSRKHQQVLAAVAVEWPHERIARLVGISEDRIEDTKMATVRIFNANLADIKH